MVAKRVIKANHSLNWTRFFSRRYRVNSERQPPKIPVGVGNGPAQQRFIQRHPKFLIEHPNFAELCHKVFHRTLPPPDTNEYQALLDASLSDNDPAVIAWEDRVTADRLIFHFGLMAADDFNAILYLSGNGAGFASFVHLRSLYERLVHAMYIATKPSEARVFAESSPIDKLKFLNRLREFIPEAKLRYDDTFMGQVTKAADAAKAKRKQSNCSKCNQPITQDAWTRVSLYDMAREVDPRLEQLYGVVYQEGTNQAHANSLGMEKRLTKTEGGYGYRGVSEDEAAVALQFAHDLMLRLLIMQNQHFTLNLDEPLRERTLAFVEVWSSAGSGSTGVDKSKPPTFKD
jgi:Family of unknown function (DUF5677)